MPRRRWPKICALIALPALASLGMATAASPSGITGAPERPDALTVDGLTAPIGLGTTDVQFGWHVGDVRRGAVQTAYRIVVSAVVVAGRSAGHTSVVWDSGQVTSADQAFIAYGGPALRPDAVYQWTVQTWASSGGPGPMAKPATFETGLRDSDWQASWIRRATNDTVEYDQHNYARKGFALNSSPIVRARAYVSADQQYELYVNGARAGKGEAYSYPDTQYYETLDVTRLLRAGASNAIGVLYGWQGSTKAHPNGTPGVIAQLSVLHRDGTVEVIGTDGSWRVQRGPWLVSVQRDQEGDQVDYTENIDGLTEPLGWDSPGFNDALWTPATVLGRPPVKPWTHLVSVRTRIVEEPVKAVTLTHLATGAVVADFGKVYAAVPTVTFHHGVPLHLITMRAGYLLDAGGTVSTTRGTQHTDMSYTYVQRGGMQTFHPFDYLGFRYFQIDDPGETLSAADLVALTRHAAVPDEQAATFSSSDPGVDAVFQLGAHSALFTAQEQFIDTPTREKGPWLWDGFNESQTAMAAFSEQNLTRKSLLEFAQSQSRYWPQGAINKIYPTGLGAQDIGEFTEIYAEWVWLYWIDTGDRTLLDAVYPVLLRLSDYVYRTISPANGLVPNLPATNLYSSLAFLTRQNVLAINVFRRTGDVAEVLGHPAADVARQRQRQAALTAAVNSHLTLANGLYVDGLNSNGTKTGTSQDSNAVAMSYGIVPPALQATVATVVASEGMAVAPRTAGELLETLRTAGRDDDFVRRLTDPKADGWANILARGGTFTWEVWQPSDANGDSMSHGWGSNVLVEIQRELLGVNVTGAGYSSFEVSPPSAGVAWASGRVPTPRGSVVVDWHRPADLGGAFTLDVTVPPNASAIVRIPALGPATISESGLPLTDAIGALFLRMDNTDAVVQVGAGTYHFISSAVPPVDVGVGLNGPGAGGPEVLPSPVAGSAVSGPGTIPGGGGPAGAVGSGASALPGRQPARHHGIPLGWDLFASVSALAAIVEIARVRRRRPGTVEAAHTGVA